mgnify:CR=1 FL=1
MSHPCHAPVTRARPQGFRRCCGRRRGGSGAAGAGAGVPGLAERPGHHHSTCETGATGRWHWPHWTGRLWHERSRAYDTNHRAQANFQAKKPKRSCCRGSVWAFVGLRNTWLDAVEGVPLATHRGITRSPSSPTPPFTCMQCRTHTQLVLRQCGREGRGLVADRPLGRGEALLQLPDSLLLTPQRAAEGGSGGRCLVLRRCRITGAWACRRAARAGAAGAGAPRARLRNACVKPIVWLAERRKGMRACPSA